MFKPELSADEALEEVKTNMPGAITPSLKVLEDCGFGKVFSGRTPDGKLWKIIRQDEDFYTVEY